MALKITTQIGTDKGITSEAYVRIAEYQVSKYGSANFKIEIFQSKDDSLITAGPSPIAMGASKNQQIGETLWVALTKEVETKKTFKRPVLVQVPAVIAEDGTETTPATSKYEDQDVEETVKSIVPDLSSVESGTIFEFGYSHLKTKLAGLFGEEHVIDC